MHRAFNVKLDSNQYLNYVNTKQYENDKSISLQNLRRIINSKDMLQAYEIKKLLLPSKRYDIFISHSHKDLEIAKGLSGYLNALCGVACFIDSLYWGNIDELQEELNRMHLHKDEATGKKYFDHQSTMEVAKHANMILASALTEMIDNCECVFFLNTDNSVIRGTEAISKNETYSPWIYHEVFTTTIIQKKQRSKFNESYQFRDNAIKQIPDISYGLDLSGMTVLREEDIFEWEIKINSNKDKHPLDVLYNLNPERK